MRCLSKFTTKRGSKSCPGYFRRTVSRAAVDTCIDIIDECSAATPSPPLTTTTIAAAVACCKRKWWWPVCTAKLLWCRPYFFLSLYLFIDLFIYDWVHCNMRNRKNICLLYVIARDFIVPIFFFSLSLYLLFSPLIFIYTLRINDIT